MSGTLDYKWGLMTYDAIAATAAAQSAQEHRAASAEATHEWYTGQRSLTRQESPELRAEYLRRAKVLDGAYEAAVEDHRQEFVTTTPDQTLPGFLQPGFKAFAPQLQQLTTPKTKPDAPVMLAGYPMRTWKIAGVMGVLGVILIAMMSSCDTSPKVKTAPPATLTSCEIAMRTASQEPDSTLAEPLIMATTNACGSKAAWVAAVKKFPAAMGAMDFTDATASQTWELVCYDAPTARACRG